MLDVIKLNVVMLSVAVPFITIYFFITCEWAPYDRLLYNTRLERIVRDKRSSLLGPFERYEENEVL